MSIFNCTKHIVMVISQGETFVEAMSWPEHICVCVLWGWRGVFVPCFFFFFKGIQIVCPQA